MTEISYSCVLDSPHLIQLQTHYLVTSLLDVAGVSPERVFVHAVADPLPELSRWLSDKGVDVVRVEPFGHAHCNKLQQLATFAEDPPTHVAFLDCDIFVTEKPDWPLPRTIAARTVVEARPPAPILKKIFRAAGLTPRWTKAERAASGSRSRKTAVNNLNGGVYVVAGSFVAPMAEAWPRWARWCLANRELFGDWFVNIDQVSLALALTELGVEAEPLDARLNCTTGVKAPPIDDVPIVLHYHKRLDRNLQLLPPGRPRIDEAIAKANTQIVAARRESLLNSVFWAVRYELFPDIGSGVGSRGENLEIKKRVLAEVLASKNGYSLLDVGCGDGQTAADLPARSYVGVDIAPSAVDAARAARPDGTYIVGDPTDSRTDLTPADVVLCFDVLIHQSTKECYERLVTRLAELTKSTLVIGAYDGPPVNTSSLTFYYEPISATLERLGSFKDVSVVGTYRDTTIVVASRD